MQTTALSRLLLPFARLIDKAALAPSYRVLVLAPDHVRAVAPFGALRVSADLGLPREVYVDANSFLQQLLALPAGELKLEIGDDRLRWRVGDSSRGALTLLTDDALDVPTPAYPDAIPEGTAPVDPAFAGGLELGALACGASATRAPGLDGVQLRNRDGRAYAYATDNNVLSACCLGPALSLRDTDTLTLKIEAAELLMAVAKRDRPLVTGNREAVYAIVPGTAELLLHQIAPLRADIAQIADHYTEHEIKVPLLRDAVASFLRRAEALAETSRRAMVDISVENGQTRLSFEETGGSTEEHYLVPDGPKINVPPIRLAAHRIAPALAHAEDLIFDYADKRILILRGPNDFIFAVTGRSES